MMAMFELPYKSRRLRKGLFNTQRMTDYFPLAVPNLVAWGDSSFGVTNSSGAASAWTWRMGPTTDFTQGTAANRFAVTTYNGRQTLSCDGNDAMTATWAAHQNLTAATYVLFLRPTNAGTPGTPAGVTWLNTTNWYFGGVTGAVATETWTSIIGTPAGSVIGTIESNYDWAANEAHMMSFSVGASGSSFTKNASAVTLSTFSGTPGTDRSPSQSGSLSNTVQVGATSGGFNGLLLEVLIYSRQLTAAELTALNQYRISKWGA
jgi:hypothetical protein